MADTQRDSLYFVVLGCTVFILLGSTLTYTMDWSMADFKSLFYAARCLHAHLDPFDPRNSLNQSRLEEAHHPIENTPAGEMAIRNVYPPTVFLVTFPLAALKFEQAALLWGALNAGCLVIAAFQIWNLSVNESALTAGAMIGFLIANAVTVVALGNAAGISIGLCIIALWCFLKDRYSTAGILCFALSIMLKPQNCALIWLFLLMAGGRYRRRAAQTALATAALSSPLILWTNFLSPHWMSELASNIAFLSARGGVNDPGPSSPLWPTAMVNLQTVVSLARNDPHLYNPLAYALFAALFIPIATVAARSKPSQFRFLMGLAAISALTMLAVYHRRNDTKLLLLSVPACVLLCRHGGLRGRVALAITSAALFFTADLPWIFVVVLLRRMEAHHKALTDALQAPLVVVPAPLSLLAMSVFYVWAYMKGESGTEPGPG